MKTGEAEAVIPIPSALDESNRALGTDELNLCEFPLALCSHRAPADQKSLTFEDRIFDDGNQQPVHRKLTISASDAFGLPTPVDSDVLLVLMHLTNCRTRFQSATVPFTRYELVKFLGWDNGGKSYKRLEESLQRWASVTLYYNRAWWDRDRRRWRSQTFHVLESLDLRGKEGRSGPDDDGQSSFTWNSVLFNSFQSNYLKRIDLNTYFKLQIPAARQAYRFLDKRFYRSARFEMDLRLFACEHVGLARSYDSAQLKRQLKSALAELESIGFLKPTSIAERYVRRRHGEWQIVLYRQSNSGGSKSPTQPADAIVVCLTDRGVRASVAASLVREFSKDHILEKIDLHDWLVQRRDQRIGRNPAGYLAAAIREDYKPPKGFICRVERERHQKRVAAQQKQELAERQQAEAAAVTRQTALAYLDSLTGDERAVLESVALQNGDPEAIRRYRKHGPTTLGNMLLKELVIAYLKSSGLLSAQAV